MKTKVIVGITLLVIVAFSTLIALLGVWGVVSGDRATQLIVSAIILGAGVYGVNATAQTFLIQTDKDRAMEAYDKRVAGADPKPETFNLPPQRVPLSGQAAIDETMRRR